MSVQELNSIKELDKIVEENENVILACSLTTCIPCKEVYPKYEALCEESKEKDIVFIKMTFDLLPDGEKDILKKKYNIPRFPAFVLLVNGICFETRQTDNIEHIKSLLSYI